MSDEHDAALAGAWAYERLHVDAMFRTWAEPVLDAAGVRTGHHVLDVACGTGIVAREAIERVGPSGSVTGLDLALPMLAVAAAIEPKVTWCEGDAAALPFADAEFDAVVSQFGLMFVPDRVGAIREMFRCVVPDAPVVVAVWDSVEQFEVYPILLDLLRRRAGPPAADALRAPFVLGDTKKLDSMFAQASASEISIDTRRGTSEFPSVRAMVEAELRGWLPIMGVDLVDDLIESILTEADELLSDFVTPNGTMAFDASAHIVTATR